MDAFRSFKNSLRTTLMSYLGMQIDATGDIDSNVHSEQNKATVAKDEKNI